MNNNKMLTEIMMKNRRVAEFMGYYQPANAGTGDSCFSHEVYYSKEQCIEDFPGVVPLFYNKVI